MEFRDIEMAAARIASGIVRSPCPESGPLSEITGCRIFCKLDYLQRTGSFKERGARNALLGLNDDQRGRGVIAASAGNHALGLCYHASLLGIHATVVMPKSAPLVKITNCRRLGARVMLEGTNIQEAHQFAETLISQENLTYINGFNDPAVIAGQGTLGLEVIEQVPDLDAIIVPIGGAGLIAGVALAIKTVKPSVKVFGVEAKNVGGYGAALRAGRPVKVHMSPTLADGLALPCVGENSFAIARQFVDRVASVREHSIALAILRLMELEKSVVEGAAATSLAACLENLLPELRGKKVVLPLCGGNIDMSVLGRIIEGGLAEDGRLARFGVTISDKPGGLAGFSAILAEEGASIFDIAHDRAFARDDVSTVLLHCVIETRDRDHIDQVKKRLQKEGYQIFAGQ